MKTLLGLFIFFGLAGTGSSLECEVCSGLSTSCHGSTVPCEAGKDTCIITVSQHSLAGIPVQTIDKTCGSLDNCRHGLKYMDLGHGKTLRSSAACCVGDACRTATVQGAPGLELSPTVPPAITEPNGKRCPACYALSSAGCLDETVDCHGPEHHCLDLAVRVTYGKIVVNTAQKGCVSKSVCSDLRREETSFPGGSATILKAECKPAGLRA